MTYQGKEVLRIWQFVTDFQNWTKENISNIPIINQLFDFSPFGHLLGIIDKIENSDFGKIVKCFLKALHGINRAFNSYTYSELNQVANTKLNSLIFTKNELSLFQRTQQADSYLDKDFLNLQFGENSISIPEFILPDFLEQWITDAKKTVTTALDSVNKLIDSAKTKLDEFKSLLKQGLELIGDQLAEYLHLKKFINSLKNKKKTLEEVLKKWGSQKISIRDLQLPPIQSKSAIVLVPSIAATLTTIGGLATFFLSLLGIGTIGGITVALKHFVTSIVTTFFTSSGAIVSRYFAAAILRFNETVLPAIFQKSGMAGTAWCYLMQFAFPVLVTSVLIITLIKSKLTIGNHIYIYGDGDTQLTILGDVDSNNLLSHAEIYQVLTEKKLSQLSQKIYSNYYGFSVNPKNEVIYGLDLNTDQYLFNSSTIYSSCFPTIL